VGLVRRKKLSKWRSARADDDLLLPESARANASPNATANASANASANATANYTVTAVNVTSTPNMTAPGEPKALAPTFRREHVIR